MPLRRKILFYIYLMLHVRQNILCSLFLMMNGKCHYYLYMMLTVLSYVQLLAVMTEIEISQAHSIAGMEMSCSFILLSSCYVAVTEYLVCCSFICQCTLMYHSCVLLSSIVNGIISLFGFVITDYSIQHSTVQL